MGGNLANGLRDIAQLGGAIGAQPVDVRGRANRGMDHRTLGRLEGEIQAHALERQKKVGKDDGRVDVQLLGGGDRDLGGELGVLADFEQRMMPPDGLIFRHVPARLAQEPDGGAVDRLPQASAHKTAASGRNAIAGASWRRRFRFRRRFH